MGREKKREDVGGEEEREEKGSRHIQSRGSLEVDIPEERLLVARELARQQRGKELGSAETTPTSQNISSKRGREDKRGTSKTLASAKNQGCRRDISRGDPPEDKARTKRESFGQGEKKNRQERNSLKDGRPKWGKASSLHGRPG